MQAQDREIFRLAFDRAGQRLELRVHRLEEGVPIIGELHRLPCAGEQLLADEILEIADPARQRGRAEPEFIGCGACRAETDGAHERLERAQGR